MVINIHIAAALTGGTCLNCHHLGTVLAATVSGSVRDITDLYIIPPITQMFLDEITNLR